MNEIVKVTWIDAQRLELGVIQEDELPDIKPIPCDIVGFLVHEDKERIIVAQEKWKELGGCKYVHVIPKVSIIKITKLKEKQTMKEENKKKLQEGFKHFCDCIDFGKSYLDAEAMQFMNEFGNYLE